MQIQLDDWQKQVLGYQGDLGLCTGRRVGKTYILSRKGTEHMRQFSKPIIVVSLTEDQAMIIITMALTYARENFPHLIGKGKYKPTLKTLTLMIKDKEGKIKPVKLYELVWGEPDDMTIVAFNDPDQNACASIKDKIVLMLTFLLSTSAG